jgi:hypothetical protein
MSIIDFIIRKCVEYKRIDQLDFWTILYLCKFIYLITNISLLEIGARIS